MTMWLVTTSGTVSTQAQPEPAAEHLRVVPGVLVVTAVVVMACMHPVGSVIGLIAYAVWFIRSFPAANA